MLLESLQTIKYLHGIFYYYFPRYMCLPTYHFATEDNSKNILFTIVYGHSLLDFQASFVVSLGGVSTMNKMLKYLELIQLNNFVQFVAFE